MASSAADAVESKSPSKASGSSSVVPERIAKKNAGGDGLEKPSPAFDMEKDFPVDNRGPKPKKMAENVGWGKKSKTESESKGTSLANGEDSAMESARDEPVAEPKVEEKKAAPWANKLGKGGAQRKEAIVEKANAQLASAKKASQSNSEATSPKGDVMSVPPAVEESSTPSARNNGAPASFVIPSSVPEAASGTESNLDTDSNMDDSSVFSTRDAEKSGTSANRARGRSDGKPPLDRKSREEEKRRIE